jgi:hypothetical protein
MPSTGSARPELLSKRHRGDVPKTFATSSHRKFLPENPHFSATRADDAKHFFINQ